ncbi:MAG: cyclic nucleotide-binding domain-containing protein [Chloroflexota bacterium]|nr:cyclic nucleotide-binding domain-containing protein [Chloroflexota bacterium]
MSSETEKRVEFLKQLPLFGDLSDEDIAQIERRLAKRTFTTGELVFSQGDVADSFYIVLSGRVEIWRIEGQKREELGIFEAGDHFGEDGLLFKRHHSASIAAIEATNLLYLDEQDFTWWVRTYPSAKPYLSAIAGTHRRAQRLGFDWLIEGEVIYLITRRHVYKMLVGISIPFLVFVVSFVLLFYGLLNTDSTLYWIALVLGCLLLLFAIPWGLWKFMDWRNDYFVVTSQRVIWLENVLLHSNTRHEFPLTAIQSAGVNTSFIGRILSYGDVMVRTYTGNVVMTNVDNPYQMSELIDRLIKRMRGKSQQARLDAITRTIRQKLGYQVSEEEQIDTPQRLTSRPKQESQRRRFSPLRTREVDGDIITYHKHWYVLIVKMWPLAVIFMIGLVINQIFGIPIWMAASFFVILLGLCWYSYEDWDNDIYRLTKDKIIDREKKPIGRESVQAAPLKNVLSVEHERKNILRIILNIGTVKIYVGDITFKFFDVHNPAQVHQDIFDYKEALMYEGRQKEAERERERVATWLEIYHEQVSGHSGEGHEPDFH